MRCKEQGFVKRCVTSMAVIVMILSFQVTGLEAGLVKNLRFIIELKGGYALWSLDDFGISQKSYENRAQEMGFGIIAEELKGSLFGGIDLTLEFHNLGLSAGFRHFPGGTFENGLTSDLGASSTTLDLSTFVIPVELYYKLPVGRRFFFKLSAGVDYYKAAIDYDYSETSDVTVYFKGGTLKDSGMGAHLAIGGQYMVGASRTVAITFGTSYHFARLNNFTGALGDTGGQTAESLLIMRPDDFGEVIGDYPAGPELPTGYRPAIIDFNGFRAYVGFTVSPCKPKPKPPKRCPAICNCLGLGPGVCPHGSGHLCGAPGCKFGVGPFWMHTHCNGGGRCLREQGHKDSHICPNGPHRF